MMDGLMDRYSPRRGEIDLTDYRRFQSSGALMASSYNKVALI
jgi:hypothetical protein